MKRSALFTLGLLPVMLGLGFVLAWLTLAAPAAAQPAQPQDILFWTEDFSAPLPPAQYYITASVGSGVVVSDSLILTQDVTQTFGRIFYQSPTFMSSFSATFDIYLGSHNGADGLAFHFCPTYNYTPTLGSALDATCPGGTFVAFDTYPSGSTVYVAQGDYQNVLTEVSVDTLEDGAWHHATVNLELGFITVILDEETVIDNIKIPGYVPFTGYFGFSASTGAETNTQRVDTIRVSITPGVYLSPPWLYGDTLPGNPVTYTGSLINNTGMTDSFSLAVDTAVWPTSLSISNSGPLAGHAAVDFTIQVQVPDDAQGGDFDLATIRADSDTTPVYSDTQTIRTTALSGQNGYVFNADDNLVNIVDTVAHVDTGLSIDTTPYGDWPWAGELSPDGEQLYVSLRDGNAVLVADTVSNTPVISIPVGAEPFEIAFSPAGEYAFVANFDGDSVSVIDTAALTVTATIPVGDGPQGVASSACLDKVYVIDRWDYDIYVLDTTSLTITEVITGFTNQLFDIVISPYGYRAYVTNQWDGTIYVIDTLNDTWIDTWYIGAASQNGLDISPDGRTLYMTSNDDGIVYVLDAFTGQILNMIITGPGNDMRSGWDIETFPAGEGDFAYTSQPGLGQVSVLDTATREVVNVIDTGGGPRGMALFPPESACLSGVILDPPYEIQTGLPGTSVVYTQTLYNLTGEEDSFALAGSAPAWGVSLSLANTGPVASGGWVTFTVQVDIPASAQIADYDIASITAISDSDHNMMAAAQLKTAVPRPGYVFNTDANLINVVDTAAHVDTGIRIDTTPYGDGPLAGELSPDGEQLYVSLMDDNAVLVVDTVSNTPVISIPVGSLPFKIAFSPAGEYAFVANRESDSVSVIDTVALTVTATIPVGDGPQGVASSACLDKVYVVDRWDYDIYVLNTTSLTVTHVITGFTNQLFDIVISPLGDRAYVTNQWDFKVYVIDTTSDTWIDTFNVPAQGSIESIDISPNGSTLYITSNDDGRTYALDANTGDVVSEFGTGPSNGNQGSWGIEVFPWDAGPYAYVSSPEFWNDPLGDVKVLNLATNQVVGSIYLGGGPRGMALFPPAAACGAPPTANFSPLEATVAVGQLIAFTNLSTGTGPLTFSWDFGDDSPVSSAVNPVHAYSALGDYTVVLTVDGLYGTAQIEGIIHVTKFNMYMPIIRREPVP